MKNLVLTDSARWKKYHYALLGKKLIKECSKEGVSDIKKPLLLLHYFHSPNTDIPAVTGYQSLDLPHPNQQRWQSNPLFLGLIGLHTDHKVSLVAISQK